MASHMIFGLGLGAALGFLSTTIIGGKSKVPIDTTIIDMSPDQISASAVISTLSIALIFVRMLQYFTFSKKLSAFSEIIAAAAFDILFFAIMWCVMLAGFAIAFFALYGRELAAFRAVSSAYLAAFKMSANEFQYDEM